MADKKAEQIAEEDKKLAGSAEMSKLFRALAILNGNAVNRVMKIKGAEAKISRAEIETKRLIAEANLAGNHKCPKGMIWDESLKRCVPLA